MADAPAPADLTESEITDRLAARPDLLDRFRHGDATVLAELITAGTGVGVQRTTVRSLA